jgi:pimeloyl-ACP methyl ester carboxylesterase
VKALKIWLGVTAILCVGAIVADQTVRRRFGRPPRREVTGSPTGAVDVQIGAVDGSTVRGWWFGSGPGPAALVIHGWGGQAGDMLPVADVMRRLGLNVLLLDARGHGRSADISVASMPSFADDVRSGLGWLRSMPGVDPGRIVLVGHSVGAGACLFVASGDPEVAGVVSLASMADPSALMAGMIGHYLPAPLTRLALRYVEHVIGHRYTQFAPVHTIGRISVPVLLLHGAQDTTVPVADAHRLHALAPANSDLLVVADADHFSIEGLDTAEPQLRQFLQSAGVIAVAPLDSGARRPSGRRRR